MTKEEAVNIIKSECYVFNPLNFDRSTMVDTALDMAIKALDQEPCEDAISRKSMLDYLKYLHGEMPEEEFVKALPPVTPKKDGWTPCSEQLPKPKETENLIAKYYLVQNEYGDMIVARWDGKGWEQMYQHEYLEDDVIAWMPLPEKYKAEEIVK